MTHHSYPVLGRRQVSTVGSQVLLLHVLRIYEILGHTELGDDVRLISCAVIFVIPETRNGIQNIIII